MDFTFNNFYKPPFTYNNVWDYIEDSDGRILMCMSCSNKLTNNIVNLLNCNPSACKLKNLELLGEELYVNGQWIGDFHTQAIRDYNDAKKYYTTLIKLLSDD